MSVLSGTLVVSLEQAVAAPYASRLLAEGGARVIKIEREEGDFARDYDQVIAGESAYFVWLNAGKESLVLDVKHAADMAILKTMLARADVFLQNLRPGVVARLGLDYESLAALNPGLVMCSISGYGEGGALSDLKAYDFLVQAESGLCAVTGTKDWPARCGVSVCDISTGLTAYGEILRALLERTASGRGRHVEVSLFGVMTEWMTVPLAYAKYGGKVLTGTGLHHAQIAPYGAYETADGLIIIAVQNQREWLKLCTEVLDDAALATDARFKTNVDRVANRDALQVVIETVFKRHPRAALAALLESADIAYGRINTPDEVWDHPQLKTKEVELNGRRITLVRRSGEETSAPRAVPRLGAHTDAIKQEFAAR